MTVQLPVQLPCNVRATSVSATPRLPISKLHACTRAARLLHGIGSWQERIDLVMLDDAFRNKFLVHHRRSTRPAVLATERQSPWTIGNIGICSPEGLAPPCWEQHGKVTVCSDEYQQCSQNLEMARYAGVGDHRRGYGCRVGATVLALAIIDVEAVARGFQPQKLAAARVTNLGRP